MAYSKAQPAEAVYRDMIAFGFPEKVATSIASNALAQSYIPLFKEIWIEALDPTGLVLSKKNSSPAALGRGKAAVNYVMFKLKEALHKRRAGHNDVRWFRTAEASAKWFSDLTNAPGLEGSKETSKSVVAIAINPKKAARDDVKRGKLQHRACVELDYSRAKMTSCPCPAYVCYVPPRPGYVRNGSQQFLAVKSKGW